MDININMEIHTFDSRLAFDLMESNSLSSGDKVNIGKSATLTYKESQIRAAIGFPEIIEFTISFGTGVASEFIVSWIYDKLKGKKVEKIMVDRKEVQLKKGEIMKVIEERMEINK